MAAARGSTNKDRHAPLNKHLGARIRYRRKQLDMSQGELGQALGMTFQQVQKYEHGSNRIGAALLYEVGEVMGVPVTYFFDGLSGTAAGARPAGLAEAQDALHPGPDGRGDPAEEEVSELVRAYARIPDPAVRERIMALLRTLSQA